MTCLGVTWCHVAALFRPGSFLLSHAALSPLGRRSTRRRKVHPKLLHRGLQSLSNPRNLSLPRLHPVFFPRFEALPLLLLGVTWCRLVTVFRPGSFLTSHAALSPLQSCLTRCRKVHPELLRPGLKTSVVVFDEKNAKHFIVTSRGCIQFQWQNTTFLC